MGNPGGEPKLAHRVSSSRTTDATYTLASQEFLNLEAPVREGFNYNLNVGQGRAFLLDIHYRAHPGVDTALECVLPVGKPLDLDGLTGSNNSGRCQAGSRLD